MLPNRSSLQTIRNYLDDVLYSLVDLRLSFEVPQSPTGFPRFDALNEKIDQLDPIHRSIHRLLRLGLPVRDDDLRASIPAKVIDALRHAGILILNRDRDWQTDGCLLVPIDGLLLFVGVPPSYPTASQTCRPWFDLSTFVIARALPLSLENKRVLDVCAGSGVQSLLSARRGAEIVVGLELDAAAVDIAKKNAVLNALDHRVEFRVSDGLQALRSDETFDFVICNTPYSPTVSSSLRIENTADVGNIVLMAMLESLPTHLSERGQGLLALWRTVGAADWGHHRHVLAERLRGSGITTVAFLDRAPDTLENVMRIVRQDLIHMIDENEVPAIEAVVRDTLSPAGHEVGFYNEIISFRRGEASSAALGSVFGFRMDLPVAGNETKENHVGTEEQVGSSRFDGSRSEHGLKK
jgi:methylase of polypeptide subunit release factors